MQIGRLAFFGWVWEPYQSLRVAGDSKDDKERIDLSLWEFGDDTAEMEISRFTIINLLL